jgi:tRNA pseudouridine38-40 synthase
MPRYRLDLEYDGTPYVGWQRQDNGISIQEILEHAIFSFCGETAVVFGAGRTDSGVHAQGQVAHVDLAKVVAPETLAKALNYFLRAERIVVLRAGLAAPDFHARFSATWRRYEYRILTRRAPPTFERGRVWHLPAGLDARAMHGAAQALIGRHDFTTFRSAHCQATTPVKTLDELRVVRRGDLVLVHAKARSFLHNQVRIMVGSLKRVGDGSWPPEAIAAALAARDRTRAGPTAPPDGLVLMGVGYDAR